MQTVASWIRQTALCIRTDMPEQTFKTERVTDLGA